MKIKIKNKEGFETEVKPENIVIQGVTLLEFYEEFIRLKRRVAQNELRLEKDAKEMYTAWKNIKK